METDLRRLRRVGFVCLATSGVLSGVRSVLDFLAGPPPSIGADILAWTVVQRTKIALSNELLAFSAALLVPTLPQLHALLQRGGLLKAILGCGLLAAAIPVLFLAVVFQGRFVYPIGGLSLRSADSAELLVALYLGSLHLASILRAAATVATSLALRTIPEGGTLGTWGLTAAVVEFIGSYPDFGPVVLFACQIGPAVWFIALGLAFAGA